MRKRLQLSELLTNMEFQSDDSQFYYDPKENDFVFNSFDGIVSGGETPREWTEEEFEAANLLEIPAREDIDEYSMMADFAEGFESESMSAAMRDSLHGKGAFRRFRETVHRLGIEERWYKFRDEEFKKVAIEWCEEHGIEYEDDEPESPVRDDKEAEEKAKLYKKLEKEVAALLQDEFDAVANAANLSALLYHALLHVNWVGFYFRKGDGLTLGPFQGKPACVRIAMGKGVCGTAASEKKTLVVPDVHQFPGHIACDANSNSEIVVPLMSDGTVVGVLDLDSPLLERFDAQDQAGLERLAALWTRGSNLKALGGG